MLKIKEFKVPNSRLLQGEYYPFKIVKNLEIDETEQYFVLQDPLGYKILMPSNFYRHYNMQVGETIRCRVDKINCNGRMFLEPAHPIYQEGEVYEFKTIRSGKQQNIYDKQEHFIVVEDKLKQQHKVYILDSRIKDSLSSTIECYLERIKKGKFFLRHLEDGHFQSFLKKGQRYEFLITGETINPFDKQHYFLLLDAKGTRHVLKKKYYVDYNLRIGQKIWCHVEKFTDDGYFALEPDNPWYEKGQSYVFKTREINRLVFSDGNRQDVLVLENPHGEDVKVFIDDQQTAKLMQSTEVTARVKTIRKSRLKLVDITGI